jgi:hypothetical protein
MRFYYLLVTAAATLLFAGCVTPRQQETPSLVTPPQETLRQITFSMKGVGIDLPQQDFIAMKTAGIDVLATEWGMEEDAGKARVFLDQAEAAGLKVVMDGGFSSRAWGFTDDDWEKLPEGKRPVWQKEKVQKWILALKDHPAIMAWDICNEFGENLPSGAGMANPDWPGSRITTQQLIQAKADVLAVDPTRPIHARMYGWDIGDMPLHVSSLLENRIADIISLNLYSNYLEKGKLQWPDVINDGGAYFVDSIKGKAPGTKVWMSVAAFEYSRIFQRPTPENISRDMKYALKINDLDGISFFCWGPVNQWDVKSDWYLPKTGADLWGIIQREFKQE